MRSAVTRPILISSPATTLLLALTITVGCGPPLPPAPGANLLLLSVDSLRCDRLWPWTDDGPPMPHLEQLQARGTVLTNAWAVAPWTAPSMVSVFTGLYPPAHGVAARDDTTPPQLPTLMRQLHDAGYRLGNLSFFSQISYFRNLGLPTAERGLQHSREAQALGRFLERGDDTRPFAVWVHLLEPHLPYGASGYRARKVAVPGSSGLELSQLRAEVPLGSVEFDDGDRERILALYDHDLTLLDRSIGRVMDELEVRDLLDETIVVLVADHGEELLDHGWVGHASTAIHAKLIPEILHVPMVLAGPGIPVGVVSDALTQQVDLLPTINRLLGLSPPDHIDGGSLDLYADRVRSQRRWLYFDTTVGGNLTPSERRHERLQAISDGACLVQHHTGLDGGVAAEHLELTPGACTPDRLEDLEDQLATWQRDQATQRMAVLAESGESRPGSAEIERMATSIQVLQPTSHSHLDWSTTGGRIDIEWSVPESASGDAEVWIEYATSGGIAPLEGAFQTAGTRIVFGPFPQGFWNDVAAHSPFRFRVVAPSVQARSDWVQFELRPAS